ncbi:hypothetical protein K449DRAFT_52103 [Hypoxylon sp. EC38]|nr:hypothetical protein K449DRAFT_52103 [Hypoxylon sp. EC38]
MLPRYLSLPLCLHGHVSLWTVSCIFLFRRVESVLDLSGVSFGFGDHQAKTTYRTYPSRHIGILGIESHLPYRLSSISGLAFRKARGPAENRPTLPGGNDRAPPLRIS